MERKGRRSLDAPVLEHKIVSSGLFAKTGNLTNQRISMSKVCRSFISTYNMDMRDARGFAFCVDLTANVFISPSNQATSLPQFSNDKMFTLTMTNECFDTNNTNRCDL